MNTATFAWGDGTITVRAPTVKDELTIELIGNTLIALELDPRPVETADFYARRQYARFLQLATLNGAVGFTSPDPTGADADEALLAGLLAFEALPSLFLARWRDALERAAMPPAPLELQPADEKKSGDEASGNDESGKAPLSIAS